MSDTHAAVHEAGHTLAAWICGCAGIRAYLKGAGGGRCKTSITIGADDDPEARAMREALINISGLVAEDILLPGPANAAASKADLLALRTHYEMLVLLKSPWAGTDFDTFKGLVSGVVGILLRRYRGHVAAMASDLRAYDSGLSEQDVQMRCSGDIPRDLSGKGWELAYLQLVQEAVDALEKRLPSVAAARHFQKGGAAYGIK